MKKSGYTKKEKIMKPISRYARIDSVGREPRNSFEALRRYLHLTQHRFGEKLGLSKAVVHIYEAGISAPPMNAWLRMKEIALQNGIELTDDIYASLMQKKAERMISTIDSKVKRMKDKIESLQKHIITS